MKEEIAKRKTHEQKAKRGMTEKANETRMGSKVERGTTRRSLFDSHRFGEIPIKVGRADVSMYATDGIHDAQKRISPGEIDIESCDMTNRAQVSRQSRGSEIRASATDPSRQQYGKTTTGEG